jgi:uncharacterized SAM-binding protein YcdF (DUF218 family)
MTIRGWWRRSARLVRAGLVVAGVLFVVGASPLPQFLARAWVLNAPPRVVDAIVVLGGGVAWPGVLLSGSFSRLEHGVRLYHEGYAPRLILTGAANPRHPAVAAEAVIMRQTAIALGVSPEHIVLETRATRTYENGLHVARLMQGEAWHSALIVTDALHMRRAQLVFDRLGVRAYPSPGRPTGLTRRGPGSGLLLLERLGREIIALAVYKLRGWA